MPSSAAVSRGIGGVPRDVRNFHERLLLTMIRQFEPIPASDLARQTDLSAQTVSVILRKLEDSGLLLRDDPVRGKVGKPSVPFRLDPEGSFAFGIKLGRRSADLALIDMCGQVRDQLQIHYPFPRPDAFLDFVDEGIAQMTATLPRTARDRIDGIGLAMPFDIWKWNEEMGAPPEETAIWQSIDLRHELAELSDLPVFITNDATAGCYAENVFGHGQTFSSYLYLFVGFFMGGGVVLNHAVYEGPHGNAGGIGPIRTVTPDGRSTLLMDIASLHALEGRISEAGKDPTLLWDGSQDWSRFEDELDAWIDEAAFAIANAALSACALVDFEAVILDGAFPVSTRDRLVDAVRETMQTSDSRGIILPEVLEGKSGANARVVGAAYSPIAARHFLTSSDAFATSRSPLAT